MDKAKRMIRGPQASDEKIFIPSERIITRNAGCWNCVHARHGSEFWTERRQKDLDKALGVAITSSLKEDHPTVVQIRRMVAFTDGAVAERALLRCAKRDIAKTGDGTPIGDLVANSFMCNLWTGAQGASIARGAERINDLAEDIRDKLDGNGNVNERLSEIKEQADKDQK